MEKGQVFGVNSLGLLARYNLDTHSLRTYQCSFIEDLEEYSVTLPKSGMIVNGRLSELMMWVQDTEEKGYGLWRTPDANLGKRGPKSKEGYEDSLKNGTHAINLLDQVKHSFQPKLWHTPSASDGGHPRTEKYVKEGHQIHLSTQVAFPALHPKFLPTPVASDGTVGSILGENDTYKQLKSGALRKITQKGTDGSIGLGRHVQIFPTPAARDWKDTGDIKNWKSLDKHQTSLPKEVAKKSKVTGHLNPTWVEWLMGFPIGWTNLKD